jgi:hypothetical protein
VRLKTSWRQLPEAVRRHLNERLRDRRITASDLYKLQFWLEQPPGPDVPEGDWFKDFGTFKLAGRGELVLTFLTPDQAGYGTEIKEPSEEV